MTISIGAYEAKTHLARLLDEVAAGRTYAITKHGREVARLVPPTQMTPGAAAAQLRQARQGLCLDGVTAADLVAEGRRW
ncbi:MAG: type II toxin-antitoxin system prevent-host-death family antitoxin [Propionibacteriaceae bacterium]|nr:type II toxin-antitoxin system prevent-host-death family antitoxin [Propionibacteriaceae bacterium]